MSPQNQNNRESKPTRKPRSFPKDVIDFSNVGGLGHNLKALRETVIIPLLHGNIYSHFKIKAPRGVLFYGPPGKIR